MYCPNCGRKISANSQFCPYCGNRINHNLTASMKRTSRDKSNFSQRPMPAGSAPVSRPRHNKKIIWVIVAIIVIIAAGFGYYQYKQYKQSPASVNLATAMPGHDWKIPTDLYKNKYYKGKFDKHFIHNTHASFGKNYFEWTLQSIVFKLNLQKIHGNDYYFDISRIRSDEVSFSGDTVKVPGATMTRHGNKVTVSDGAKHESVSLHKLLHSDDYNIRITGNILDHKPIKLIKA